MPEDLKEPVNVLPKSLTCRFYLETKRRFCKFDIHPSSVEFCGFHTQTDSRVPCPLDPHHTVYKHDIKSHLERCTSREPEVREDWFHLNYNLGHTSQEDSTDIQQGAATGDAEPRFSLEEMNDVIAIVDRITARLHIEEDIQRHWTMDERIQTGTRQKHTLQQSSLIGQMSRMGLLTDMDLYVEWGAGKAEFSHYVSRALPHDGAVDRFLLIDRQGGRSKHDRRILEEYNFRQSSCTAVVSRKKVDIAHINLERLVTLEFPDLHLTRPRVCSISKHLCGAATDLTLNCLLRSSDHLRHDGVLIALCCHQLCSWQALNVFVRNFLLSAGLVEKSFHILTQMTSWHTSGLRKGMDEHSAGDHWTSLSTVHRSLLGWKCKRALDVTRQMLLEHYGWTTRLLKYEAPSTTLECFALAAKRSPAHNT